LWCSICSFLCSVLYIIVGLLSFFFWPLYCLFFFELQLLITLLVTVLSVLLWVTAPYHSFGHCIVCSSLSYTPYYSFGHYIVCSSLSYSSLLLFWSLYCLFFFELQLLITLLVTVLSVLLW
jgi:hypothetical protein